MNNTRFSYTLKWDTSFFTYNLFKDSRDCEPYLKINIPRRLLITFASFRTGSHNLEINIMKSSERVYCERNERFFTVFGTRNQVLKFLCCFVLNISYNFVITYHGLEALCTIWINNTLEMEQNFQWLLSVLARWSKTPATYNTLTT